MRFMEEGSGSGTRAPFHNYSQYVNVSKGIALTKGGGSSSSSSSSPPAAAPGAVSNCPTPKRYNRYRNAALNSQVLVGCG